MEYKCFQCGHDLIIENTWTASDIGLVADDKCDTEDDFEVYVMDCPYCGVHYKVAECPMSEQSKYEFYKQ